MNQALQTIESVLRDYGHQYHANLAAIARQRFASEPRAACRLVNSAEWWEDADSLAAIDLAVDGGFTARARLDASRLRGALGEVMMTMLAYGERNDTGEILVAQFQKWDESRV